jgi:methylglutaconyl-CoA hydratase
MDPTVRIGQADPVATLTMARPEVHNAFNEHLIAALHEAFLELGRDPAVRVIVLAGEGKSFSVGADLDWMRRMGSASEEENRRDATKLAAMLRTVAECPKPVVARVHGNVLGGGAGLTAAADVAIAGESAVFGFSEVRLGLAPATIAPHVIEKIGAAHALPRFLTGDRFDAREALRIGLVYRVVPDDAIDEAVSAVVEALLAGGPEAQVASKQLVRRVGATPRGEIDAYTAELIGGIRASGEGREGVTAFLDKRKPNWVDA